MTISYFHKGSDFIIKKWSKFDTISVLVFFISFSLHLVSLRFRYLFIIIYLFIFLLKEIFFLSFNALVFFIPLLQKFC